MTETNGNDAVRETAGPAAEASGAPGAADRAAIDGTLEKLHGFERFGSKLGLERMTRLLQLLGDPQKDLKVIHVAGTNGKGSVCRYIYSVLCAAGYRAGLYTSPFLERFNERMEAGGRLISDEELTLCAEPVLKAADTMVREGGESPTEFEVVTAMAFVYFRMQKCDYVVLEVGLGGRGDSTNVCASPLVTVITSISMDHMDRLGGTIEEIAREKAGILKQGRPVVVSASDERAVRVIREEAAAKNAEVIITGRMPVIIKEMTLGGCVFDAEVFGRSLKDVTISMAGEHQVENAVAAVSALSVFEREAGVSIGEKALREGLSAAKQPGRFEVLSGGGQKPVIIIDGAHNEDGARKLAEAVKALCPGGKILMAVGMLADKDTDAVTDNFLRITNDFIAAEPENPRKLSAEKLCDILKSKGARCIAAGTPEEACRMALEAGRDADAVIFAGSLYLIGKIRSILKNV